MDFEIAAHRFVPLHVRQGSVIAEWLETDTYFRIFCRTATGQVLTHNKIILSDPASPMPVMRTLQVVVARDVAGGAFSCRWNRAKPSSNFGNYILDCTGQTMKNLWAMLTEFVGIDRRSVVKLELPMIENPELTLRILRYIAQDDVPFPANLTYEKLLEEFPDERPGAVACSIIYAYKAGLLMGAGFQRTGYKSKADVEYRIGLIDGLEPDGAEYVWSSNKYFGPAVDQVKKEGKEMITPVIKDVATDLAKAALKAGIQKLFSDGGSGLG